MTITETLSRVANEGMGYDPECAEGRMAAEAILAALTEAGYAIVPREPTPSMLRDGCDAIEGVGAAPADLESDRYPFDSNWKAEAWCSYRAMISATPDTLED